MRKGRRGRGAEGKERGKRWRSENVEVFISKHQNQGSRRDFDIRDAVHYVRDGMIRWGLDPSNAERRLVDAELELLQPRPHGLVKPDGPWQYGDEAVLDERALHGVDPVVGLAQQVQLQLACY